MRSRRSTPLSRRLDSLRYRIEALTTLRRLAALRPESDLSVRQWAHVEGQLGAAQARLLERLDVAARATPPGSGRATDRALQAIAGELELQLARAFTFFDTYMDVLTQRQAPELAAMLRGCDALAADALRMDHPALAAIERPIVFTDRGFGAAVLRSGVPLPDGSPNPLPLVQIPYSRLREKHNLGSIHHECGHEALVRLRLTGPFSAAARAATSAAGATPLVADFYASWMGEIGPDFWTFCCTGLAQAAAVREILALPPRDVFRIVPLDPHPPPHLRVVLSCQWCRERWGRGPWDDWEREWRDLYPPAAAPAEERRIVREAERFVPALSRMLFTVRFKALGGRRLPDLFDLAALHPSRLARIARGESAGRATPSTELAAFRLVRESGDVSEEDLDRRMTSWLEGLGRPPGTQKARRIAGV